MPEKRKYTDVRLERHQETYIRVYDDELYPGDKPEEAAWEMVQVGDWDTYDSDEESVSSGEE